MYRIKLSISIVVYGESFLQIKDCLLSLLSAMPPAISYEITLVDNGALELQKNNALAISIKNFFVNLPIDYLSLIHI